MNRSRTAGANRSSNGRISIGADRVLSQPRTEHQLERLQRREIGRGDDPVGADRPNLRPVDEARETGELESGGGGRVQAQREAPQRQGEASAAQKIAAWQPGRQPVPTQYRADVEILG